MRNKQFCFVLRPVTIEHVAMKHRLDREKALELQEFLEAESKTKMATCFGKGVVMRMASVYTNTTTSMTRAATRVHTTQIFSYIFYSYYPVLILAACFYLNLLFLLSLPCRGYWRVYRIQGCAQ